MSDKRNARPAGGTAERAKETAAFSGAVISCNHSITDGAERQPGFIAGLLLYGPENGMTLKDLVHITQWPERAIRKEIEVERRAGTLIISDNRNGYYLTDDPPPDRSGTDSRRTNFERWKRLFFGGKPAGNYPVCQLYETPGEADSGRRGGGGGGGTA